MTETLTIPNRFQGPPGAGNGGYVSGRLAAFVGGPVAVRFRASVPLDVPLPVHRTDAGVELRAGDTLLAQCGPAELTLELPEPPNFAAAERASRAFRAYDDHPLPRCFVCGVDRAPGDGLRIFPGPVAARPLVAAPWVPERSLAGEDGEVPPEFLWSALDCPGAFTFPQIQRGVVLSGELAASLTEKVFAGQRYIVAGWELGREGRKHFTGTAIFSAAGACCGYARGIWIEVPGFGAK